MLSSSLDGLGYRSDKLRLARNIKGLSLEDVGEYLDVSRQNIHKMETGKEPKEEQIESLCKLLDVKRDFFYAERKTPIVEEHCHFRSLRSRTKSLTTTVMARAEIIYAVISEVGQSISFGHFEVPDEANFTPETFDDIEKIAESLRKAWDLGEGPISDLTIVVENAGIIVAEIDGVDERVDAFSMSRQQPIIIRNSAKTSPCRYRFDLAHELGHLIMHDGIETGCMKTEKQANYFASAFLMHRTGFKNAVEALPIIRGARSLNWKNIFKLKIYFQVSFKALLYRAKSLGLIDESQMKSGYIYINKKGWSKEEALDDIIPVEHPETLQEILNTINYVKWENVLDKLGLTQELVGRVLPGVIFPKRAMQLVK